MGRTLMDSDLEICEGVERRAKLQRGGKTMRPVFKVLGGVVIGFVVLAQFAGKDEPAKPSQAAQVPIEKPPIEVDVDTLFAAYAGNELAGDRAWKGRLVAVTGVVAKVEKTLGDVIVALDGAKSSRGVFVYLNEDQEQAASGLVAGQRASFAGIVGGAMVIGGVKVTHAAMWQP